MTKEEILKQVAEKSDFITYADMAIAQEEIREAMDTYAKQEAIAFLEWATGRNLKASLGVFVDNEGAYKSMEQYYLVHKKTTN